ncbi:MAG TPA: hypothetical protein VHE35_32270, partial [Kofleriaceae bacterium]|nr:hypothetical protein [Kofleriaceae bacterium]
MPYVTFLLDLVADDGRLVPGTLRDAPDPACAPASAFQWKVTCDDAGFVVVRALDGTHARVLATARWDGALRDREQRGGEPNDAQWQRVALALGHALDGRAAHDDGPVHLESPGPEELKGLRASPPMAPQPPPGGTADGTAGLPADARAGIRRARQQERRARDPRRRDRATL